MKMSMRDTRSQTLAKAGASVYKKPTTDLIDRFIRRLERTRLRETEADPGHLLEAVTVIVYDPDTAQLHPTLPPVNQSSGGMCSLIFSPRLTIYGLRINRGFIQYPPPLTRPKLRPSSSDAL